MRNTSSFGKNNFDRLEAAGLVAGEDDSASQKAKTEQRIQDLDTLAAKIKKVEVALAGLFVLDKPKRLKLLSSVTKAVKGLHASELPIGTKKHVTHCINELTSLREGVYTNAAVDRKSLSVIACAKAREDIQALAISARAKLEKITADSTSSNDLEEFYRKAADVINKNAGERSKLVGIDTKPFVVARAPVIPVDGGVSAAKLPQLGFKVDSISGYAVIHNQLVIGINAKLAIGDAAAQMKGERLKTMVRAEADRVRKELQKRTNTKLQFVCDAPYSFGQGIWFWIMPNTEIDAFARAFPSKHVAVSRWGFAFN